MFANRLNIGAFGIGNCVQVFKMEQTEAARKVNKEQIAVKRKKESEAGPSREEPEAGPSREEPEAGPSSEEPEAGPSREEPKAGPSRQEPEAGPSRKEPEAGPSKKKSKKREEPIVWKWWEEEKLDRGIKWQTLSHNGPVFAPPYERVPTDVKFLYSGKPVHLSEETEEVAALYSRMLDNEYTSKAQFQRNFFKDWRAVMTNREKVIITDLKKCDFQAFHMYYKMKSQKREIIPIEEKLRLQQENEDLMEKFGYCIIDGHKQRIGNFKIEPPGLFRGRGNHPKMGKIKKRIEAEDVVINIGKEAKVPPPPLGHMWKEIRHDNTVSWLAKWTENIFSSPKYIMLNPSSKLKGEKDWQKFETARKLRAHVDRIRDEYTQDFKSDDMRVRQRAVALYFIDQLALRAGNEKDEDTADTVGCCSLRVEHISLDEEKDGKRGVVNFDFLGKDSIRYVNSVTVVKEVFNNLRFFMEKKKPGTDLFDKLTTSILNKYLNGLMEGLTAKVFRTYNASKVLQDQLNLLTTEGMIVPEKVFAYNRANRAVAVLCNHQRTVSKSYTRSMDILKTKMDALVRQIRVLDNEVKAAKKRRRQGPEQMQKKLRLAQLQQQLKKLKLQAADKEESKLIALGTSKLNYLDPRISVACVQDKFSKMLEVAMKVIMFILFITVENAMEYFLDFMRTIMKYCIFIILLYCECIKDFFEILVYTTIKIAKRTIWTIQAIGLDQKLRERSSPIYMNKSTQTESLQMKEAQNATYEDEKLRKKILPHFSPTSPCKVKLSFSSPKCEDKYENFNIVGMSPNLSIKDAESSPAVLKLEADFNGNKSFQTSHSPSPLCSINVSLSPRVETKFLRLGNEELSKEERSVLKFLKKKLNNWKFRKFVRKQFSIFQNNAGESEDLTYLEKNNMRIDHSVYNIKKSFIEEPISPTYIGCCSTIVSKLKSKFYYESESPSVSYRRF
ncbi:DNA topoisomerase 1 [Caerostris darwini]|uniref:DNA topoisomerase I n=1 Tax=Caerostris darwini TaxID=1538125 RepID=A0AAV4TNL5_9ARAC|nr:DNA topoisomerase 1 [Caerostris darwini]